MERAWWPSHSRSQTRKPIDSQSARVAGTLSQGSFRQGAACLGSLAMHGFCFWLHVHGLLRSRMSRNGFLIVRDGFVPLGPRAGSRYSASRAEHPDRSGGCSPLPVDRWFWAYQSASFAIGTTAAEPTACNWPRVSGDQLSRQLTSEACIDSKMKALQIMTQPIHKPQPQTCWPRCWTKSCRGSELCWWWMPLSP